MVTFLRNFIFSENLGDLIWIACNQMSTIHDNFWRKYTIHGKIHCIRNLACISYPNIFEWIFFLTKWLWHVTLKFLVCVLIISHPVWEFKLLCHNTSYASKYTKVFLILGQWAGFIKYGISRKVYNWKRPNFFFEKCQRLCVHVYNGWFIKWNIFIDHPLYTVLRDILQTDKPEYLLDKWL